MNDPLKFKDYMHKIYSFILEKKPLLFILFSVFVLFFIILFNHDEIAFQNTKETERNSSNINPSDRHDFILPPPLMPKHSIDKAIGLTSVEKEQVKSICKQVLFTIIKPWEISHAKYLPVKSDRKGRSLHILLPPLEDRIMAEAVLNLSDHIHQQIAPDKEVAAIEYGTQQLKRMIHYSTMFTIITAHLADETSSDPDDVFLRSVFSESQIEIFEDGYRIRNPTDEEVLSVEAIKYPRLTSQSIYTEEFAERFGHLFKIHEED